MANPCMLVLKRLEVARGQGRASSGWVAEACESAGVGADAGPMFAWGGGVRGFLGSWEAWGVRADPFALILYC